VFEIQGFGPYQAYEDQNGKTIYLEKEKIYILSDAKT